MNEEPSQTNMNQRNESEESSQKTGPTNLPIEATDMKNKTFADVCDDILIKPGKLISLIILILILGGMLLGFLKAATFLLDINARELQLGPGRLNVLFVATEGKRKEYLTIVHPQGWQNTGIHINKGQRIIFKADGRVNIDGGGLFKTIIHRKDLEEKLRKKLNLNTESNDERDTPEYRFSKEANRDDSIESVMLLRPWIDPNGFPPNTMNQTVSLTFGNRGKRLELPSTPLGCLIGRVGDDPTIAHPFKIGAQHELVSEADGDLYLNVNDVKNLQPNLRQEMFYQDNLGFFSVIITIHPE